MSETTKNLYQRILAVMEELDYVQKEAKKNGLQYSFVSHDAVTAKIHPLLVKHGIAMLPSVQEFKQDGNRTEATVEVAFVNVDDPTQTLSRTFFGYGIDSQDKGPGKAMSYAVKYAMLKTFCLETGDDPERDQIEHDARKPGEKAASKPATKTTAKTNGKAAPTIHGLPEASRRADKGKPPGEWTEDECYVEYCYVVAMAPTPEKLGIYVERIQAHEKLTDEHKRDLLARVRTRDKQLELERSPAMA